MSRLRRLGAAVFAWLADRADVRRDGSSAFRPRYWLHRLAGANCRAAAQRLEITDE